MAFVKNTTEELVGYFTEFLNNEKKKLETGSYYNSDSYLDYIIELLDIILKLDSLKTYKAPLNNDFSAYRRHAGTNMKEDQTEQATIYNFLSQSNAILKGIALALSKVTA
jgi:hypothetical protein